MGEPLSNYEAVKAAVGMMGEPRLFGIGARHITVSTVGVIPRIKQMAADLPVGVCATYMYVLWLWLMPSRASSRWQLTCR
jgi:adenine C2-methylase RlmN of 23S rRNA A2503 and tRNA A37